MSNLDIQTKVQFLKGVGPRRAEALAGVGIETVYDLLHYLPRRYIDRSMITPIGSLKANMEATIIGKVLGKGILKGRTSRLEVVIGDESGYIALVWFAGYRYLEKMFNKGDIYAVTGPVTYYQQTQMVHPEIERIEDEDDQLIHTGRIVPVYPSTADIKSAGVTGRVMRQLISKALELVSDGIIDFLPKKYLNEFNLLPFSQALHTIHYPEMMDETEKARKRLAFNELLELQFLILNNRKNQHKIEKPFRYNKPGGKVKTFLQKLPFKLTGDQEKAVKRIYATMRSVHPMHRLLQGDVGCGKTVVALLAAVFAAENNLQTALMAPTELLAEQHFNNWHSYLQELGIRSALLTGSMLKKERRKIEEAVINDEVEIMFGTHAVLSDPVKFARLGLVIIDEQHRFGVMQRGKLISKGSHPDVLVMTATPIPRTLALTLYGDLDITSIKTLPPGRIPGKTVWRTGSSRSEIYEFLKSELRYGAQIFFIYPLVEKSEKLDLQAAEEAYEKLKSDTFRDFKVGLIHGRIKKKDREKIIKDFREKRLDALVATTVVEVGLDIPSASIMVIEHAERFGLSQLHQLRGRVGRGSKKGITIAIATTPVSKLAVKRLDMFQASSDGFRIAEADLELRGPGEFFGTRQHGLPELKIANLIGDTDLLPVSRKIVINLLSETEQLADDDIGLFKYLEARVVDRQLLTRFG